MYHYHIRKCRRSADVVKKNKLLDACVNGNGEIFEELKKMRRVRKVLPQTMDGSENVSERFKNVYQKLYNSVNDVQGTRKMLNQVDICINSSSLADVDLVTPELVYKAAENVKKHKNDPSFSFNSDCFKRGPKSLFQHLSTMIKCFLIHGHVC